MIPRTARPSRRSVVGVAAAGLVSGCSAGAGAAPAGRRTPAAPPPGSAQKARAARESLALLGRYDSVLAAHPALGALLRPLRAEVAQHAAAFGGRVPGQGGAPGTAGGSTAAVPSPVAVTAAPSSGGSAPPTPAAALTALAAAERDLAARRTADLADVPGDLARLLASVAGCAAGHAALLAAGVEHG